eukprot:c4638_g1_i1.p1 GENE.c4638_g1_i1~~c4638_g1_i1.p1  ORF type:complete len:306 (+),score=105.13 c4638_g1_i1:1-918(+)
MGSGQRAKEEMAFLFSSPVQIQVLFDDEEVRKKIPVTMDKKGKVDLLVFQGKDSVSGKIELKINPGKAVQHSGITVELIGQIEVFYDRGNTYDFTSLVNELEGPGELSQNKTLNFNFASVDKQHESYNGINVRLRYFVRVCVKRQYAANITKEIDFWVQNCTIEPEINNSIKMEVGIEDCLHIEFEYNKSKYHLRDVVIGKVFFLLVRIKIKHMEVAIIKRESQGSGPNLYNESETITKFEVMDGAPVRGESIPVRLFLGGYDMTPTMRNVHSKFSVKYYLNLVLVDEEDRRYFKQQEITIYRKD